MATYTADEPFGVERQQMNYSYLLLLCAALVGLSSILHAENRAALTTRSMTYVLRADKLARSREKAVRKLASCDRDLIVLDYAYGEGRNGMWTAEEIDSIRKGKRGRKIVAYISIGEAEDYRPYWRNQWDSDKDGRPDKGAAPFLNAVNPDWEGNYKVRYWHKSWQSIILKYVDEIREQGFDGLYLDIVDAFEFYEYDAKTDQWQDNRKNPDTGKTYRQDMVAWVKEIARHAREAKPNFLIVPQNGVQLLTEPGYVKTIDAIGIEDLFTNGNKMQKQEHINFVTRFLENVQKAGKPVFIIEYGKKQKAREYSVKSAESTGLMLLLTNRKLSILGIAVGAVTEKQTPNNAMQTDARTSRR